MKTTIYKYRLDPDDDPVLELPFGFKIIHVGQDPRGDLCFWAEVKPDNTTVWRRFYIVGTGHPLPTNASHVGSAVCGPFVWHVYVQN